MASEQIWIRQEGGSVQGPFPSERVTGWMRSGRVRAGMELSGDGQEWIPLTEDAMQELLAQQGEPEPTTRSRSARSPATKQRQNVMGCLGLVAVVAIIVLVSKVMGCSNTKVEVSGNEAKASVRLFKHQSKDTSTLAIAGAIYETATANPGVEKLVVTVVLDPDGLLDQYGKQPKEDQSFGTFTFTKQDLDEARKYADRNAYRRKMEQVIATLLAAANPEAAKFVLD